MPSRNRPLVAVLAAVAVATATSSFLMVQDDTGKVANVIRSVDSLATSADGKHVAFASGGQFSDHQSGGTVYFEEHTTGPADVLRQPKLTDVSVLAVVGDSVYFRGGTKPGDVWDLYRWDTDKMTVRKLQWHDQQEPQSRSALVRCTVSTGQCELAPPLSPEPLLLGS